MGRRQVNKLSPLQVSKERVPGYHGDGGGLYLQVSASGSKSWVFKYMLDGRSREMGLGPLHTISLADARVEAARHRKVLLDGKDPILEREAARQAQRLEAAKRITFTECAKRYIEAHRTGWKNPKHAAQWENTISTYAEPIIGALSVADVDTSLVLRIIEPIWTEKTETASRLRGRIEKILDWAKTRGFRTGENPARWAGHLEHSLPKKTKVAPVENYPALPYSQIADFVADLRKREGISAIALEFSILTASRCGTVRKATWSEIDRDAKTWICSSENMKMGKAHRVPLSGRALEILDSLPEGKPDQLIFPSPQKGKELSDAALGKVIKDMNTSRSEAGLPLWIDPNIEREAVPHGFRSSFKDWAAEETDYPNEMSEMALAHKVSDKVEAAYRRGNLLKKRFQMMEDWANWCSPKAKAGKVLPIHKKTA